MSMEERRWRWVAVNSCRHFLPSRETCDHIECGNSAEEIAARYWAGFDHREEVIEMFSPFIEGSL